MYNDIKLEKGLYNLSGKSFLQALETLDPSENYSDSPLAKLDAYERQLKRFDIKVSGKDCDNVEKFFVSTESAVLFPEFIRRSLKKGFDNAILSSVIAAQSKCESNSYIGCVLDDSAAYSTTAQGAELPASSVTESSSAVTLSKYGRIVNASYESVRLQKLDVFAVMLSGIGVKLANSVIANAVSVLLSGAVPTSAASLSYSAITSLYGQFRDFDMNALIVSPAVAAQILAMTQMLEVKADGMGRIALPFGAQLVKTPQIADDTLVGIDKDFALEFISSSDIIMETDKLINRQLDSISISINCGFRKLTPDAVKVLKITA
jgi:hypothetical protein